ncbi:MAG: GGDEF domain-containing protein [Firmicutes bacterium]|nr:GGDEF domain-containing protein [Bacillota bacterium]
MFKTPAPGFTWRFCFFRGDFLIYAATGIKELDEELERMYGAKIIYYRQAFMEPEIGKDGDIAIISPRLQGEDRDLVQVIYTVRKKNVRVILLTGGDEELAAKCVAFGVYDILGGSSVDLYELKEVIDNPRRFGDLDVEPQVTFQKADARPQDERQSMLGRLKGKIFNRPAKPEKKNRAKTKKSTFHLKNLFRRSREDPVEVKWMLLGEQDALTGLLKREAAAQYPDCQAAMFCDLDGFKKVNDTYGHAVGDRVLAEFARTLKKCVRADDPVVRWGGDEFVVLFSTLEEAERTAGRVKSTWENNMVARQYNVSVSIGLGEGPGPLEAAAAADREMYRVKHGGQPAAEARVAVVSQDALICNDC